MFRKKDGSRGAVSVFLIIILVPCLMCSSLCVDAGRVHLSKATSSSAADLALNSLLTHYDYDLSDFYGLMASCQTIDEFYEETAKYYIRMLESANLSDDEMKTLVDQFAAATGNDVVHDLLRVEVKTETKSIIKAVDGANLTNSTIMKDQIVEFMKYRAPIEIVTGIIDALKKGGVQDLIDSDKNKPIVDAKQEFYETDADLTKKAFEIYKKLMQDYTMKQYTNADLKDYISKFNGEYKNLYKEIHDITFRFLHNTEGVKAIERHKQSLTYYQNTYKNSNTNTYKESVDGTTTYYIEYTKSVTQTSGTDIKTVIKDAENSIANFKTATANYAKAISGIQYDGSDRVQYWVRAYNALTSGGHIENVKNKAAAMLKSYSKLAAILDCELGKNITASLASPTCSDDIKNWESTAKSLMSQIESLRNTYLGQSNPESDSYLKLVKRLESISGEYSQKIHQGYHKLSNGNSIDATLSAISSELSALRSGLEELVDALKIIIDGRLVPYFPSIDSLADTATEYETDLNTWYNTASSAGTDMGNNDVYNIENSKNQGDKAIEQVDTDISYDNVMQLKKRLVNIKDQLVGVINAIDNLKYGNKKLVDIKSFEDFHKAFKSGSVPDIPLNAETLKSSSNTYFSTLYKDKDSIYNLNTSDDYNIELDPRTGQVAIPELYRILHQKYKNQDLDEKKEKSDKAKDDLDNLKETVDTKLNGTEDSPGEKDKERHNKNAAEISKEFSPASDADFKLGDGLLSGLVGLVEDLINLDPAKIRDDIYVTTYIMNMFSYATYENEGKYSLVEDKAALTLASYPGEYDKVTGDANTKDTWLSEAMTDSYNKSLRNKMINASNNAAYGCEVEYVLYGGTNKDNVKAAYADILTIREALNLVAGFQHFWTATNGNNTAIAINGAADAIAMATSGIVPAVLTKSVMIAVLATLETINDLACFQAGFPVPIYKDVSTWQIQFPNEIKDHNIASVANATSGENQTEKKGLQYSDYLMLFVYLGLTSDRTESAMYQRIAEVIQTNIRKLSGDTSKSYSMKKAIVYFSLDAKLEIDPLLINMPIFKDYESYINDTSTWCSYSTKIIRGYT